MQQKHHFYFYALMIAIVLHLIVTSLVYLFLTNKPFLTEPILEKRMSVSLKETFISPPKEHLVKAKAIHPKPTVKTPPKTPISQNIQKPIMAATPTKPLMTQTSEPLFEENKPQPMPKKEPPRPNIETPRVVQQNKEHGLYDFLSKPEPKSPDTSDSGTTKVNNNIQRAYGEKFNTLSQGEQKFILDNMTKMLIISNNVLRRYEPARIPSNFTGRGEVLLEFYLHPNGDITDLKILKASNYSMMNDLFLETINLSFSKYPHPEQKTLIRWIGSF